MEDLSALRVAVVSAATGAEDCSPRIQAYADELDVQQQLCTTATAAIGKFAAAVDAAHSAGASACKPSMLGLSFLRDALAVCVLQGSCGPVDVTEAQNALQGVCASTASPQGFAQTLSSACGLLGVARDLFNAAATCCGDDGGKLSECASAANGLIPSAFPNPLFNQHGVC